VLEPDIGSAAPGGEGRSDDADPAHPQPVPAASTDHLDRLISRVAAGDRLAFHRCTPFWQSGSGTPPLARCRIRGMPWPVTRSTFLEVWHTAGAAAHYDARDWIAAITAFRG
jgi:hypothetical protein